ncbi:MAG TPA: hypothetical protein VFH51_15585, partial [Myxococcota bacterium]|nr:hypothetical protein [Myxococcota bacterium]
MKRRVHLQGLGAALALAGLAPLLVAADINHVHPPMNSGGLIHLDAPTPLAPGQWAASGWLDYAYSPLVWRYNDGTSTPAIAHALRLEPVFALGLTPLVDAAVALPLLLRQGGPVSPELGDLSGTALGDVRVLGRLNLLPTRIFTLGLALVVELTLPTG